MNKSSHSFQGVLLLLSALLFFAYMDTTTKYLAHDYNVPLIVAVRYITHCLLMLLILAPRYGKNLIKTQRTGMVLVRASSLAVASLFMGLALQRMPVAETTAIIFLAPMVIVLLAGPLLGERIGMFGWLAAIVGFVGVLLIARPNSGLDGAGTFYAFCAVAALVTYQMLSRSLAKTEETIPLLFYTALVGAIVFACLLPWSWHGPSPSLKTILLFLSVGLVGGVGHFLYTAAFRHAPASLLAPMNYLQLLWAGLMGWLVFDHMPDHLSLIGMCVIAASGAMIAFRSYANQFKQKG